MRGTAIRVRAATRRGTAGSGFSLGDTHSVCMCAGECSTSTGFWFVFCCFCFGGWGLFFFSSLLACFSFFSRLQCTSSFQKKDNLNDQHLIVLLTCQADILSRAPRRVCHPQHAPSPTPQEASARQLCLLSVWAGIGESCQLSAGVVPHNWWGTQYCPPGSSRNHFFRLLLWNPSCLCALPLAVEHCLSEWDRNYGNTIFCLVQGENGEKHKVCFPLSIATSSKNVILL